ncbi:hypothetical protein TNCV_2434741 [Trichonephila clavipes]|nr:hypothetical protein TNCV_2434741 [Trichonephila clavipes]
MSFTRIPGSGRPRQTVRREDSHIGPLCLLEPYKDTWPKAFRIEASITCAALDAHSSTPPFGVVPCTRKLVTNAASQNSNRVRVWRPRSECIKSPFLYNDTSFPQLV